MSDGTKRAGVNILHTGETLVVGGAMAYAEGRMSADNGEWGFRNVPYAYIGGGILLLTGLYISAVHRSDYGADLMAAGTGAVGAHLFRGLYESGLAAKQNRTAGGRHVRGKVPMGSLSSRMPNVQQPQQKFGTAFDNVNVNGGK